MDAGAGEPQAEARRRRRAQTRRDLSRAIRTALPKASEEAWTRIDHWWGFEYRHVSAIGKRWIVRGIWPRWVPLLALGGGLVAGGLFALVVR